MERQQSTTERSGGSLFGMQRLRSQEEKSKSNDHWLHIPKVVCEGRAMIQR
jgi:hypothetical protein